jgi:outer membrane protein
LITFKLKKKQSNMRIILMLLCFAYSAQAKHNESKVACVTMSRVLDALPDTQKIQTELEIFGKQLQNELTSKIEKFQIEAESFNKGYNTMTDNARKQKEIELQIAQSSIEELKIKSEDSLAQKRTQLLEPLLNEINNAITNIAKANSYTLVLNKEAGLVSNILYIEEHLDITNDVIKMINTNRQKLKVKGK